MSLWRISRMCAAGMLVLGAFAAAGDKPDMPEVNGGVGSCKVVFTVTDSSNKPIYNAKVEVTIRFGFAGMHKTQLEVGTDGDGRARVTGLPEKTKKPLEFRISKGEFSKSVPVNPVAKCDSAVTVVLGDK